LTASVTASITSPVVPFLIYGASTKLLGPMDPISLDGSVGSHFEEELWKLLGSLVTFMEGCGLKEFFLIVSVGHSKFKRSESSATQILHSVIGDNALSLRILQLSNHVFQFSVALKLFGFHVYKCALLIALLSKLNFIFGSRGPNSDKEFLKWE
jgi:hypothetical protein